MTDGIPARSSIAPLMKEDAIPSVKYSPRNIDMAIEKGKEIIKARKDVNNVPTMKGIAPNFSYTGSQVVPYIKLRPNLDIDGREPMNKVIKIVNKSITMHRPEKKSIFLNIDSDKFE